MVSAPLSETFGRRFIYIFVTPVALLFILGAGFARNLATLAVCRLLAGITVSAPLAVGAGTIMDTWSGIYTNRGVIMLMTTAFLGPALGEVVGGWIAQYKSWQWTQWTTLFLGGGVWMFALGAQETYAGPIIRRRDKKLGIPAPPTPVPGGLAGVRFLATVTLTRPLYMLLREPIVLFCSLYSSLNFSILFCFLASIPLIFSTTYGFMPGESGLVLVGIAVGCMLGGLALMFIDLYTLKQYQARHEGGSPPPERMLWGAMLGGPLMAVSLFWFAWTARPGIHWMSSIVATGLFGCSNILVFVRLLPFHVLQWLTGAIRSRRCFTSPMSTALSTGPRRLRPMVSCVTSSVALFPCLPFRVCCGHVFGDCLTIAVYENLSYPWASSLLGFLAAGFALLPWIFFHYGVRVRRSSAYIS